MRPRLASLMLDRLGKVLHEGDVVLILGVFPATIKDFVIQDGELGAVVQRPSRQDSFVYFEEIERLTFRAGKVATNGAQERIYAKAACFYKAGRAS